MTFYILRSVILITIASVVEKISCSIWNTFALVSSSWGSVFSAFWHRLWYFSLKMVFQADSTSCPPFVPPADSGVTDGANSLAHSCWINIRDKIPARLLMTKMLHTLAPLDSLAKMALAWRENNQDSFYSFRFFFQDKCFFEFWGGNTSKTS